MGAISPNKVQQKQLITLAENLPERVMSRLPGLCGVALGTPVPNSERWILTRWSLAALRHTGALLANLLGADQHGSLSLW